MKTYNGFSSAERSATGGWLRGEFKAGRRTRGTVCCACGQDKGVVDQHSEDYGKPYGPHVGQFPLCYRCHLMLHCREGAPRAWQVYRARIRLGWRYPPVHRRTFDEIRRMLRQEDVEGCTKHPAPLVAVLDEIHAGQWDPRRREQTGT